MQTIRLTPIQQGMIFHQLVDAHSGVDIEQIVISQAAPFDASSLRSAWRKVIAAHSALRCLVVEGDGGGHVFSVLPSFEPEVIEVDCGTDEDLQAWLQADRVRGFDIFHQVPIRLALINLPGRSLCVWTFHHLLLDGRSFSDVLADVFDVYDALADGRDRVPASRPDAGAFGGWLDSRDVDESLQYWKGLLRRAAGMAAFADSSAEGPRHKVERRLSPDVMTAIERCTASFDLTLNALLQAAWATLLSRYTDQDAVVFAAIRAGRDGHVPDARKMLGVFINTVPVLANVGELSAVELARTLRAQQVDARKHEHVSLADMKCGPLGALLMYDHEDLDAAMHRIRPSWVGRQFELLEQTSYPVTLYAYGGSTLRLQLSCAESALSPGAAGRMLDHLVALLTAIASEPMQPARRLPMLSAEELRDIDADQRSTRQDVPRTTISEAFRKAALADPGAPALTGAGRTLSYGETLAAVENVAAILEQRGVKPGSIVGVSLDRSLEMVVIMLGILRAGAAYLPLDPDYPVERLEFCARDARIPLVVTQRRYAHRFTGAGIETLLVENLADGAAQKPQYAAGDPQDVAYVIYTSGSTGRPKGVLVTHQNVVNFFAGMDAVIDSRGGKRWLAVTSTSFDISVLELLWTLVRGFEVFVHGARSIAGAEQSGGPAFSLFHFASGMDANDPAPYHLILEAARFADRHGFEAVWSPERHFHDFGAPYPNPSVMSAALSTITTRVQLRAGSVVLPLHSPMRVAEEWALVDRLSGGRVGVAFASGWQPNDFVLAPQSYERRKELMFEQIEKVRALWKGERIAAINPKGDEVRLGTYPRPVQRELPVWITAAGSPDTFRTAGAIGANVLTHMLGQTVQDLARQIAIYRKARVEAGHDPALGRVTVMVHTFLGENTEVVKELVRQPMKAYLRSAASLVGSYADAWSAYKRGAGAQVSATAMQDLSSEELEDLYEFAFERYFESAGLFGTVEKAAALVEALGGIGVDEIACLIDFGVPAEVVIEHLPWIDQLKSFVSRVEQESHDDVVRDIETFGITHLQCTPSLARMIPMLARDTKPLSSLRQVLIGGEALPPDLVRDLYELLPQDAAITNMYGPTETTIWSTCEDVPRGAERVTVGRPIANTQCYVVDSRRQIVPAGQVGELLIGGDGVAKGYHDRPELNAERFFDLQVSDERRRVYATGDLVRRLPDGRIEYFGRTDFQVKVRGHRIELGEIETALRAEAGVADAVVAARVDLVGTQQLVGYLVAAPGAGQLDAGALKASLRRKLPDYMVPGLFVWLPELPLTPNGKIDRNALPAPVQTAGSSAAAEDGSPGSDVEARIKEVWQDVLGVSDNGIKDNFFDLGGHSILAVKLQSELSRVFGKRIPIAEVFRSPTIEALAVNFSDTDQQPRADAAGRGASRGRLRRAAITRRTVREADRSSGIE